MNDPDAPLNSDDIVSPKAKGGYARAEKLTPEKRSDIAKQAASARWRGERILKATHAGELPIGNLILQCAVLEDGTRIVSRNAIFRAFGRTKRGRAKDENRVPNMPSFVDAKNLQPFVFRHIEGGPKQIEYYDLKGRITEGYDALLVPQLCDVYLEARLAGKLLKSQERLAEAAEMLARSLSKVGIIALVDEATGHQRDRAADALSKILEAFIAKELQPYVPTFPSDYYEHLFRLRGLNFKTDSVRRPQYFGCLTNDIIYRRLAPGVLEELKKVIRRNDNGRPTQKYFQSLTSNKGYPKLNQHLGAVVALMKTSSSYSDFIAKLNEFYPRYGQNFSLPFESDANIDDGL